MANAVLFYRDKAVLPDGAIVKMTIWRLPEQTRERPHGLKYSLFYGRAGERIVGYDNEAGKGDASTLSVMRTARTHFAF